MCATSPTPFKFDRVFDASDGGDLGHAADFRLRYSNADLASAAEQSFEKGCENGRFEAQQQIEGKLADALTSIARGLGQIEGRQIAAQERIRGDAVNLAHEIAATLAPALMRREPLAEITELISDCLSRMPMEPRIVVRLDETLVDLLRERIDGIATQSGFSGTVVLLGEPSLIGSDCRVEWADGGTERDFQTLRQTVQMLIDAYASATSASASQSKELTEVAAPMPTTEPAPIELPPINDADLDRPPVGTEHDPAAGEAAPETE